MYLLESEQVSKRKIFHPPPGFGNTKARNLALTQFRSSVCGKYPNTLESHHLLFRRVCIRRESESETDLEQSVLLYYTEPPFAVAKSACVMK